MPVRRSVEGGGTRAVKNFTVTVNGRERHVKVEPDTPLRYVLRNELDLRGPRFVCGLGQRGRVQPYRGAVTV